MNSPAALTSRVASACSAGQLLADPLGLHPVGQVGGDAVGRAVLGQGLDGVVDLAGVLADDDGAAAGGHDVGGGLASHPAAAADDHQLLPREDGHDRGPRLAGPVHLLVHALEPVHAHTAFLSAGCAADEPAACSPARLAAGDPAAHRQISYPRRSRRTPITVSPA